MYGCMYMCFICECPYRCMCRRGECFSREKSSGCANACIQIGGLPNARICLYGVLLYVGRVCVGDVPYQHTYMYGVGECVFVCRYVCIHERVFVKAYKRCV